jgi:hypothetical protein
MRPPNESIFGGLRGLFRLPQGSTFGSPPACDFYSVVLKGLKAQHSCSLDSVRESSEGCLAIGYAAPHTLEVAVCTTFDVDI